MVTHSLVSHGRLCFAVPLVSPRLPFVLLPTSHLSKGTFIFGEFGMYPSQSCEEGELILPEP